MIGFFEYQYLKFKKNHLRNLVALAAVDGNIHEDEKEYLYEVGKKYQLKPKQIERILEERQSAEPVVPDHHHQKVAMLFDLVGMMMADNVIEDSEMEFCLKMTKKFGYKDLIIEEMIELYKKGVNDAEEWEAFLEKAEYYRLGLNNL